MFSGCMFYTHIWIEIDIINEIFKDNPAHKSGLIPGDEIFMIELPLFPVIYYFPIVITEVLIYFKRLCTSSKYYIIFSSSNFQVNEVLS